MKQIFVGGMYKPHNHLCIFRMLGYFLYISLSRILFSLLASRQKNRRYDNKIVLFLETIRISYEYHGNCVRNFFFSYRTAVENPGGGDLTTTAVRGRFYIPTLLYLSYTYPIITRIIYTYLLFDLGPGQLFALPSWHSCKKKLRGERDH